MTDQPDRDLYRVPGHADQPRRRSCCDSTDDVGHDFTCPAMLGSAGVIPPADKPCYHPEFENVVTVGRIGEDDPGNPMPGMPTAFVAEIMIKCRPCGEQFVFDGVPAGLSYSAPHTSVDGRELRAPIRPASMPPRHRRGIGGPTGFTVEVHHPEQCGRLGHQHG